MRSPPQAGKHRPLAPRHCFTHLVLRNPAITSEPSHSLPKMLVTSSEPGRFLRILSSRLPERSARTAGSVATKPPTDAGILLASAYDAPNPLALVDKVACVRRWGSSGTRSAMHPSSKNDDFSAVQGSSRRYLSIHIAPFSTRTSW